MKPIIRPISRIEPLSEAQRQELAQWADEMPYEKAAERAKQEWGREIPKNSVARFYLRTLPARFLPDTPDTAQAAAEIVQYAATGQPKFADATIVVLERTAFELALACVHKDEHMQALKDISTMLCRYRNTSVRERMAKVQETKCDLRKEEVDLKKSKEARAAAAAAKSQPPLVQEDELGPFARNSEELQERVIRKFGLTPEQVALRRAQIAKARAEREQDQNCGGPESSNAHQNSTYSVALSGSDPLGGMTVAELVRSVPPKPIPSSIPTRNLNPNPAPSSPDNTRDDSAQPSNKSSIPTSIREANDTNGNQTRGGVGNAHHSDSSMLLAHPNPEVAAQNAIRYTYDRAEEYTRYSQSITPWPHRKSPPPYESKLKTCPCGHALPCPHHGDYEERFWRACPYSEYYIDTLRSRDLPYEKPMDFLP